MSYNFKVNKFARAFDAVDDGMSVLVRTLAFAIQEETQNQISEMDAIDTGAMRNSVYVETDDKSGKSQALSSARAARPDAQGVSSSTTVGKHQARTAVGVNYARFVHDGANGTAPRPFLHNASEMIQGEADDMAGRILRDKLRGI